MLALIKNQKFTIFLLISMSFDVIFAQDWKELDTLNQSYRQELYIFYTQKSEEIIAKIEKYPKKNVRKELLNIYKEGQQNFLKTIQKGYFVEQSYFKILIDSLHNKIVQANPEVKSIKVLFEINDEVNAYNTGEDFVSLYLPLIPKLENPYQLAYIICHEMSHQLLQHPLTNLEKNIASANSKQVKEDIQKITSKKYNRKHSTELVLKDLVYASRKLNRTNEIQADSLGFILFSRAFPNYKNEALSTLHILNTIDQEQDSLVEKDYNKLFHSDIQSFNNKWLINEDINPYNYYNNSKFWDVDSLKTHPNCKERITALKNYFPIFDQPSTLENTNFNLFKQQVQFDVVFGLFFMKEYGKSLYETLLLLKKNPKNSFLRKMAYQNLISIQKAQKNYILNRYVESVNPHFSTSYNTFLTFIWKLKKTELENLILIYKE